MSSLEGQFAQEYDAYSADKAEYLGDIVEGFLMALVYEGESDHTPITIIFRFPKPGGHCHYHIWYER